MAKWFRTRKGNLKNDSFKYIMTLYRGSLFSSDLDIYNKNSGRVTIKIGKETLDLAC